VRGAGRRGSVACAAAQRALLCAFMFVLMLFLYFRCILAFFVFVCLCAAVHGVIKKERIIKQFTWRKDADENSRQQQRTGLHPTTNTAADY